METLCTAEGLTATNVKAFRLEVSLQMKIASTLDTSVWAEKELPTKQATYDNQNFDFKVGT